MNNLAWLLAQQGQSLDEALRLARGAHQKLPGNPNAIDTVGYVLYKRGEYDSAIGLLRDCVNKFPDAAPCRYHLGMSYFKTGNPARAKTELAAAMKLDPNFQSAAEARGMLSTLK
jgi:predicted Zn-dependent protease